MRRSVSPMRPRPTDLLLPIPSSLLLRHPSRSRSASASTFNGSGLVRSRDGSREPGGSHYMNLPSPNVQTAEESNEEVFQPRMSRSSDVDTLASRRESSISPPPLARRRRTQDVEAENTEATTPPASALARRRALVPPKLMAEENSENNSEHERKLSAGSDGPRTRRSSIVVIPPMQICPGDLLVYSKVLTQRNNLTGEHTHKKQQFALDPLAAAEGAEL
ncbi:Hypothetical predicted protein [Cloeon dipterum]|uniref:Uncharacterized protein n=1 Tax=Cloeon dipterum TaxID=197152 RepID=A0A8S1DFG4_9INSE|nr:Hypothetical predicted protein [Cloeon dipterum]